LTISIIGTGNVASHLLTAFYHAGFTIDCIYGRNKSKSEFTDRFGIEVCMLNANMFIESDLVVICVSDDAILEVSNTFKSNNTKQVVVHTSGTKSIDYISRDHKNRGIFYPLQTFTKDHFVNIGEVPFCIYSKTDWVQVLLKEIALKLSNKVAIVTDEERLKLHVAAVFINNFINFLVGQVQDYTKKEGVDFDLLSPLLNETLRKTLSGNSLINQTGPAKRKDFDTIKQHEEILSKNPILLGLYTTFTNQIIKHYENNR
jgi:predicted short-subunit dehydrogenase-like oxidoreductase (DUF2520 family)